MARLLAIVLVLAGLGIFLVVKSQGTGRAFGGALARFGTPALSAPAAAYESPVPARARSWDDDDRPAPVGIGQGVRDRVNRAMDTGARRAAGGDE